VTLDAIPENSETVVATWANNAPEEDWQCAGQEPVMLAQQSRGCGRAIANAPGWVLFVAMRVEVQNREQKSSLMFSLAPETTWVPLDDPQPVQRRKFHKKSKHNRARSPVLGIGVGGSGQKREKRREATS
jgi:hypothetical protein